MKALLLAVSAAALAATLPASASATSLSYGNQFTNACYEAAVMKRANDSSFAMCNTALTREASTRGDQRVAVLVNRGILRMVAHDSKGALSDFDHALALDPTQSEAWLGKAIEHWKAGDSANAIAFADRAIRLRTLKPELAYLIRGLANEERGRVKAAYADLKRARALAPDWSRPKEELARYRVVRR